MTISPFKSMFIYQPSTTKLPGINLKYLIYCFKLSSLCYDPSTALQVATPTLSCHSLVWTLDGWCGWKFDFGARTTTFQAGAVQCGIFAALSCTTGMQRICRNTFYKKSQKCKEPKVKSTCVLTAHKWQNLQSSNIIFEHFWNNLPRTVNYCRFRCGTTHLKS